MRYVPDPTGRFEQRPFYEQNELDQECENLIHSFLREYEGSVVFPLTTEALTLLVERHSEDLDCFADLSDEGDDVQGATRFFPGKPPRVQIARELMQQPWRENRLRTTLSHELGHVLFHRHLFELKSQRLDLFDDAPTSTSRVCHRESILKAPQTNWMEWQAGYASGALLMPKWDVNRMAAEVLEESGYRGRVETKTGLARQLVKRTMEQFSVSQEAANVRLQQLGVITDHEVGDSLFE